MTVTDRRTPAAGSGQLRAVPGATPHVRPVDVGPGRAAPELALVPPPAPPQVAQTSQSANEIVRTLLVQSGRGDQSAFARLYDVVIPVVMAASHLLAGQGQAEAVAERACVDVWRWSPSYARSGEAPLAWITARVEHAAAALAATA